MSDKYDEVAERIQASIDEWIAGPKDDRTFAGITAAILREAFPAPSAQGEDERALLEAWNLGREWGEINTKNKDNAARWVQDLAALRSRLAEPASSTATAQAEAIAAHGYLANSDDVGRVAHVLEQMEPAQAAPNEDSPAISSVTLRASIAVEYETERRIAAEERAARAEAALASERGKTCAACGDPLGEVAYCDVCAEEVRNPALLAKRFPDASAPDATALRNALMSAYWRGVSDAKGEAGVTNKMAHGYVAELLALLRSEPRGEVSTKDLDAGCYKVIDDMERSEPRGEEEPR